MRYDLIIIGGGMVGSALAVALRDTSWRIALVDARMPSNTDKRLFALNYSSCQLLKNLQIWPALAAHVSPIHEVHASYQGHFGAVRLQREEVGLTSLGYVVPSHFIEAALNDELNHLPNVTFYRPATLKKLTQNNTSTPSSNVSMSSSRKRGSLSFSQDSRLRGNDTGLSGGND
ncbi:MAG: Ubiquinone biosynthesis hydroxylase, UbiH/UbiF/VisC/COQ6, partial [uncultured bacterium]